MDTFDIFHDLIIKSTADNVYNSITDPKHLQNWWPLKCSGAPLIGEEYNFYFGPEYDWYGRVITADPGKSFHLKMTKSDSDWDTTSFGFDLEVSDGGVLLKFWHTGWPECNAHFRRSSFCWALLLNGLKNYVEKSIIIPYEERS